MMHRVYAKECQNHTIPNSISLPILSTTYKHTKKRKKQQPRTQHIRSQYIFVLKQTMNVLLNSTHNKF